jgi:hypothetical protein
MGMKALKTILASSWVVLKLPCRSQITTFAFILDNFNLFYPIYIKCSIRNVATTVDLLEQLLSKQFHLW